MSYEKIYHKCEECGCKEAEVIPTEYGTAVMCVNCMEVTKLNDIVSNSNQPKCPTCGSTNIQKISVISKTVGAVAFGLFSKTAKSQFKCLNCDYKW